MENVKEFLKNLPHQSGVYIMHDKNDEIIYIGKAKDLSKRVPSYFREKLNRNNQIEKMVTIIDNIEIITTNNEIEALILENNLIKEHKPKYNTLLRDDKTYPYIEITMGDEYPRILLSRSTKNKSSKFFGPFPDVTAAKNAIELMKNIYKIRVCDNVTLPKTSCMYYQIGKCQAPCIQKITKEQYSENIQAAINFLKGNRENVKQELKSKMEEYSNNLEFEKAMEMRDLLKDIDTLFEKQIITTREKDKDVISIREKNNEIISVIFLIRDGKIINRNEIKFMNEENITAAELMEKLIEQYYSDNIIPREIIINTEIENLDIISSWLSQMAGHKIAVTFPKKGDNLKLVDLANRNADLILSENERKRTLKMQLEQKAIIELQEVINEQNINRIESYDISHLAGVFTVGSMIVYENNKFNKKAYRKFKLEDKNDDFNSLKDMLSRRFHDENLMQTLPSLLLIDGGQEQVHKIEQLLSELNMDIPVVGMVKNDKHQTDHLFYHEKDFDIKNKRNAFKLVTLIQDETHNFAINYNKQLRNKNMTKSALDDIKGIGPAKRRDLLLKFKDVETIKKQKPEDLASVKGITLELAKEILKNL